MEYLKGTKQAKNALRADSLSIIKWWEDATFMSHHDCRDQSRGMMPLGAGAIISKSMKQRTNGKISTDNETIAMDDFMWAVLSTLYFIEAQCYNMPQNIMFKDNQSNMRLMLNGKRSSTKWTKNMDVKYFFMTNVIKCGDISMEYCPTGDTWANVLTKPLQGQAFCKMCSKITNTPEVYVEDETSTTPSTCCYPSNPSCAMQTLDLIMVVTRSKE